MKMSTQGVSYQGALPLPQGLTRAVFVS